MTIRNRTNPRLQRPRKQAGVATNPVAKLGTNPLSLDQPYATTGAGLPPVLTPEPVTPVVPARPLYPEPIGTVVPPNPLYPEPTNPVVPPNPLYPENRVIAPKPPYAAVPPTTVQPNPLFPEPVVPVTPTNPVVPPTQAGTIPAGYGLDFIRQPTPNELVATQMNTLLGSNSPYIRNAEQRGAEYAASRGNLNSSIGAGSARRAALEAAMPIAQADAQVWRDANSANYESASQLRQMRTGAQLEDWMNDNTFNREYNGRLAMMPISSSMDMMAFIAQRATEDPAVWTPDVMSGWMNFFNMWQGDMFANLLGGE